MSFQNMSFMIKNDMWLDRYNKIWDKIKEALNIKFHSIPLYNEKYMKAKVRGLNVVIKTNFLSNEIPKKRTLY